MKRSTQIRVRNIVVYTLLIIVSAAALLPFFWLIRSSLMDRKQLFEFPIYVGKLP